MSKRTIFDMGRFEARKPKWDLTPGWTMIPTIDQSFLQALKGMADQLEAERLLLQTAPPLVFPLTNSPFKPTLTEARLQQRSTYDTLDHATYDRHGAAMLHWIKQESLRQIIDWWNRKGYFYAGIS